MDKDLCHLAPFVIYYQECSDYKTKKQSFIELLAKGLNGSIVKLDQQKRENESAE